MKVLYGSCVVAVIMMVTGAESPRRFNNNQRQQNFGFFQRQELTPPASNAPYPSNGWQPQGQSFDFPGDLAKQQQSPKKNPAQQNFKKNQNYENFDDEFEAENVPDNKRKNDKQVDSSQFKNSDRGFYYVYLPEGRLQRVVYMTSADLQNMAYTARVQYEDVDPVSAPIFSSVSKVPVIPGARLILPEGERVLVPDIQ